MHSSRRAQRMARHHKRKSEGALSLVSLMDIFTILVFFLLVNSSTVTQLPSGKISLPESTAEKLPKENLVIMVNGSDILVQGKKVADVKTVIASTRNTILTLKQELIEQEKKQAFVVDEADKAKPREVTIMGDKEIPYKLLRKIMRTLSESQFTNISLAVQKKAKESSS